MTPDERREVVGIQHDAIPWLLLRGVHHALQMERSGWFHTACGTFTPNGIKTLAPKRKCQKCVAVLRVATLAADELEKNDETP